ncbi:MAG TPA: type I-C CRISPR-associated endonuclease Cas1c [Bacillales bacterium]|nr:type I-C CRISPR-associated endonuclease Cas1c [Bacillales bacterium]
MTTQFFNTLFVQTDGSYLSLDHETLLLKVDKELKLKIPLHHLGSIIAMGRVILSSPLIARCAKDGRNVAFFDFKGEFQYRIEGPVSGNILLRQAQFNSVDDAEVCRNLVKAFVGGKIHNCRLMLQRVQRELDDENKKSTIKKATDEMKKDLSRLVKENHSVDSLRGIEGINAKRYYACFPLWLKNKDDFFTFKGRNRRPPQDAVNAVLSFLYRLLLNDCVGAVQGVGLDPQIGFLHVVRPGRPALGLDLMEELRPLFADRLTIALINRGQLRKVHFDVRPGGAVHLNGKGRKIVVNEYQEKKKEEITHPATGQKLAFGLLPHIQAKILARSIRRDHLDYQPYLHR